MSQNTDTTNPEQDQQTTTGTALSTAPPLIGMSGGGAYQLMPDVKLPARKVANTAPKEGVVVTQADFTKQGYIGQNLVNSRGEIARPQYSGDEAMSELAKLPLAERRKLQNDLYAVGAYGRSKPSATGLNSADLSAIRQAMYTANAEGVTLDVAVGLMASKYGGSAGGGAGTRIRTTPKQDVSAVFRKVSGELLGRRLSDAEINKFVKAYNRMETAEAMGGAIAPSVEGAAIAQIEASQPEEASAMGLLQLTNIIDDSIKGLG
jgi:hypothetical protein